MTCHLRGETCHQFFMLQKNLWNFEQKLFCTSFSWKETFVFVDLPLKFRESSRELYDLIFSSPPIKTLYGSEVTCAALCNYMENLSTDVDFNDPDYDSFVKVSVVKWYEIMQWKANSSYQAAIQIVELLEAAAIAQLVGDRKVADSWFDSPTGNVSLCPWERHFTITSNGTDQAVYPLWWPSLTRDLRTEPEKMLCVGVAGKTVISCFTNYWRSKPKNVYDIVLVLRDTLKRVVILFCAFFVIAPGRPLSFYIVCSRYFCFCWQRLKSVDNAHCSGFDKARKKKTSVLMIKASALWSFNQVVRRCSVYTSLSIA